MGTPTKSGLFFLHIPKTAGTSLVSAISGYFTTISALDYNFVDLEARLAESDFAWGHISLDAFRRIPGSDRFRTAVILRDPFARLASHLRFTDRYNEPAFAEEFEKLPDAVRAAVRQIAKVDLEDAGAIGDFLSSAAPWGRAAFDNCQVQFLTDTPEPPDYLPPPRITDAQIKLALAHLETFDFVGITENIDSSLAAIAQAYGRKAPYALATLNAGNHGRRVDWRDPAVRDAMSPFLRGDVEIYRRARELLERRPASPEISRSGGKVGERSELRYDLDARSKEMIQEIASAPQFMPSKFWEDLTIKNTRMLTLDGLRHFKRTVSQNYFNWMIFSSAHPFHKYLEQGTGKTNLIKRLLISSENKIQVRLTTTDEPVILTKEQVRDYVDYVSMVWETMRRYDKIGLSRTLREPLVGDPIRIRKGMKFISQDLANSIIEYNTIAPYILSSSSRRPIIGEIGAGYGRLAYVAAEVGAVKYAIFDIPPALAVAEFYLGEALPQKKLFKFRPFKSFDEIEREAEEADILLFTANQIQTLPDKWFSMMLSISTLPEMSRRQATIYLDQMRRLSSEGIFLKQWSNWKNEADDTQLHPDDYAPGEGWTLALDRQDPIIPDFFNRVWLRR